MMSAGAGAENGIAQPASRHPIKRFAHASETLYRTVSLATTARGEGGEFSKQHYEDSCTGDDTTSHRTFGRVLPRSQRTRLVSEAQPRVKSDRLEGEGNSGEVGMCRI